MPSGTTRQLSGWLDVAQEIGERLVRTAIWDGRCCNWLDREPSRDALAGRGTGITVRALGPDAYSGTSGVGTFLAHLWTATGDTRVYQTARAALRQAVRYADNVPPHARQGMYAGWPGIALLAWRAGHLLGCDTLLEWAPRIALRAPTDGDEFDLIHGRDGAVVALVSLAELAGRPELLDLAVRLGDRLLADANRRKVGWSWSGKVTRQRRDLTGLSHGAAGAGYGLLELHRATGDERYGSAAAKAFAYEQFWFDPREGNWPDFRHESTPPGRGAPYAYQTWWCHGAPGIGLSRRRGVEILGDARLMDQIKVARSTTAAAVEQGLRAGANFSLCHGLTGTAELTGELGRGSAAALRVAEAGVERFAARGRPWPCGTTAGESLGLLLGLAGIGHFYLRLHDPRVPSVLVPHQLGTAQTARKTSAQKVPDRAADVAAL